MNNEIIKHFKKDTHKSKIDYILNCKSVDHKIKIKFALYCITDLDQYYDISKYSEVKKIKDICIKLLGDYLLNPDSVTKKQFEDAANAAAYAADAAAYAANAAAYAAAYAAYAANAADAAAYAANAAAYAANAADAAAYAAAYAAYAAYAEFDYENFYKKLYYYLLTLLSNRNIFKLL